MAAVTGNWSYIRSDPRVFTDLIKQLGVKGALFEEIWTLNKDDFDNIEPIHGFIFVYKWVPESVNTGTVVQDGRLDKIFFAKQLQINVSSTQAIINLLMNRKYPSLSLGSILTEFKDFCHVFDSNMKGLALSNAHNIRDIHNSYSRIELFNFESEQSYSEEHDEEEDEDIYHFVSFLPIDGRLYELDGLKAGPIDLGVISPDKNWIDKFVDVIKYRIDKYKEGDIPFNLLAIVEDHKLNYEKQLADMSRQIADYGMETSSQTEEVARIQMLIRNEGVKRANDQMELTRQTHDYLPFIAEFLNILTKEETLQPLCERAKQKILKRMRK